MRLAILVAGFSVCSFAQTTLTSIVSVPAGGSLQTAINSAQPGDTIVLEAGAVYTGILTLPVKAGASYVTITSSRLASLPGEGKRISKADAVLMPKLMNAQGGYAIMADPGAHHYKFVGVEIKGPANVYTSTLVQIGSGRETSASSLPYQIIFDRVYIHGDPAAGGKRGIQMNGKSIVLRNSIVTDFFSDWQETAAVGIWNTPGPLEISNNQLQAGSMSILIGGTDPAIVGVTPSDILITKNYISKPLAWRSRKVLGKNLLELKTGKRVTITSNIFENVWLDSQVGFAVNLKPGMENLITPAVTSDIVIKNNVIRHASGGVCITGSNTSGGAVSNVQILNNLFDDIGPSWGANLPLFSIYGLPANLKIENNTATPAVLTSNLMNLNGTPAYGFSFKANIAPHAGYGVKRDSTAAGTASITAAAPGGVFTYNVLFGATVNAATYPYGNYFPALAALVGWAAAGNYNLAISSTYYYVGTNGGQPGVNYQTLLTETSTVLNGR
jgi:hypothetical protein